MNTSTLWATVAVLALVVTAGVALSFTGMDAAAVVAFLTGLLTVAGGLVALLDRVTTVQRVNAEQTRKLDVLDERTNGGLDRRIKENVNAALTDRFGPKETA